MTDMALMLFIMALGAFVKTITRILFCVFVVFLLWGTLQYVCATWNDELKLEKGYYLTIWERDHYVIDYRRYYLSTSYYTVLREPVTYLEFSSDYVLARTRTKHYWVIDKTEKPVFLYDDNENIYRCSTLRGPMDSISFFYFKDSVSFISSPHYRWSLYQE